MVHLGEYSVNVCHVCQLAGIYFSYHSWDLIDLNSILQKEHELFKSTDEFRYLRVEDRFLKEKKTGFLKENWIRMDF